MAEEGGVPVEKEEMEELLFGGSDDSDSDDPLNFGEGDIDDNADSANSSKASMSIEDELENEFDRKGPHTEGDEPSNGAAGKEKIMDDLFSDDEDGGAEKEEEEEEGTSYANLFGSDDEEEGGEEGAAKRGSRAHHEDAEHEEERSSRLTPGVEDQHIENIRLPRPPARAKLYYVKLPNILGLDQRPFDRDTFEAADEDELIEGPEGQKMKPLPPETIMRWRIATDENGMPKRESNARFVRWSNGTVQLFLGGDEEILDVDMQSISKENYHIFAKQKGSIKAHGRLDNKLFFTPSTLHSKSHQKLTLHLVKQSQQKARKVKLAPIPNIDPEKDKRIKEAQEQDRIKQNQRKKEMRRAYGLTTQMLEEGEGDEDNSDIDEKRILAAKHSEPVRKRSRESTGGRSSGGPRDRRTKEDIDFINDDDDDEEDVDIENDWETRGSGSDEEDAGRKRRRSSGGRRSARSDSDSDD